MPRGKRSASRNRAPAAKRSKKTSASRNTMPVAIQVGDLKEFCQNHKGYIKDRSIHVTVIKSYMIFSYPDRRPKTSWGKRTRNSMFYAILADESGFLVAKVFDTTAKRYFSKDGCLAITDFQYRDGFVEVTIRTILKKLAKSAVKVPDEISDNGKKGITVEEIKSLPLNTVVNGSFNVLKYRTSNNRLHMTVEDTTGEVNVTIVHQPRKVTPKKGKMSLMCFRIKNYRGHRQLTSTPQSFAQ
nr:PREDICTED: interferon-activable protein 204-like isoform X1 [Latimeria chalumnae]XP_014349489.1 PREDICTED: interferon-activable protein 204-like isoform X2 [Latimeria chalumnae]|eukprot:XP_014349488.1 PREDICTED: interferon-activable protein 204-like isoform X1 [Latimeria chalumnae]